MKRLSQEVQASIMRNGYENALLETTILAPEGREIHSVEQLRLRIGVLIYKAFNL